MSVARRQITSRLIGLGLVLFGLALWLVLWGSLNARFDEVDALGGSGYSLPLDFVLSGVGLLCFAMGAILVWRAREWRSLSPDV